MKISWLFENTITSLFLFLFFYSSYLYFLFKGYDFCLPLQNLSNHFFQYLSKHGPLDQLHQKDSECMLFWYFWSQPIHSESFSSEFQVFALKKERENKTISPGDWFSDILEFTCRALVYSTCFTILPHQTSSCL